MATKIQLRRGTAAQWTSANPILSEGEIGFETDTGQFKIGVGGTTHWSTLQYFIDSYGISQAIANSALSTTDDLSEGTSNLYFNNSRVAAALNSGTHTNITFTYNSGAKTIDVNVPTVQGTTGAQGTQGLQGVQGTTGIQGTQGIIGTQGTYIVSSTAPSSPSAGNAWLNTNDGRLYIYSGAQWFEPYNNQQGLQGPQGAPGGIGSPSNINSNTNLVTGTRYFVTSASALTLTLPASPALNDQIDIFDKSGNALTYNITIARNGSLINGNAGDFVIDANGYWASLVYTGSTYGWKVG